MTDKRIGEHLAAPLLDLIAEFPPEGIAYRGDSKEHADGSLERDSAKYIVFNPKAGDSIEDLATELQEGVNFALQFSYPEYWTENPRFPLDAPFDGYATHYSKHPQDLPALTWGTASRLGQLATIDTTKNCFYTSHSQITVGSVKFNGAITSDNVRRPVVATIEDIEQVESSIKLPYKPARGLRKSRLYAAAEYLGDTGEGRFEFHSRLGDIMANKLLSAIRHDIQLL